MFAFSSKCKYVISDWTGCNGKLENPIEILCFWFWSSWICCIPNLSVYEDLASVFTRNQWINKKHMELQSRVHFSSQNENLDNTNTQNR